MTEWKTYKLGDVCSRLRSGKGIPSSEVSTCGKYAVVGGNGVRGYTDKSNFNGQCVVVGRQGAYCGNVRYFDGEFYMTEHAVVIVGNEYADTHFLAYLLSTMHLGQLSAQSAQPGLSVQILSKLEISLPPLEEQKRIAGILSAIDDKIENIRRINNNLEQQAQALYKQWFVDNCKEDWEEKPLSEIVFFQEGPGIRNWQYVEKKGVRFINIRCINDGDVNVQNANMISEDEACGKYAHFLLEPLDIVMSCSGTLGRYAIIRQEHLPLCLNTSVIRFKPAQCIEDYSFVYGYLSSAEFLNKQEEMACGSVQANFGPTHLKQIKIKVPPKDYRMKYNNVVMPIINMMLKNRSEINMLSSLRDTLLPKLMNGKMKL